MKSKTTALWLVFALALAAAIWVLNTYFQTGPTEEKPLFSGLDPAAVTEVHIIPNGAREIDAICTNRTWVLDKPVAYPAQASAIQGLLEALQKLTPSLSFSAADMSSRKDAGSEFGLNNPQFALDVTAGEQNWRLRVGNKTAPGDGVYVQIVGAPGAYVTETTWLQFLPHDANAWRDTTLVDVPGTLDWLIVTNGAQAIEFRRDVTNHLWQMVRPLQTRADSLRIVTALQQLHTAKVSRFINDSPKADLTGYGLQPSALDVWLGVGTNLLTAVHVGKEVQGVAGEVYAKREGWDAIMSVPKEALTPWRGTVNDFRDPNLLEFTSPVGEINVQGPNNFTLQRHGSNVWSVAGEKFAVEADQVTSFLRSLGGLQIADYTADAATTAGLQGYGLTKPQLQITLRATPDDTNNLVQLMFGATSTNVIYAKRADEPFVYAVPLAAVNQLPLNGDYFRDRRVWSFAQTNVADVVIHQFGKTRQLVRNGTNNWSIAEGQGIVNSPEVEETVYRLSQLWSEGWIGRKFSEPEVGITTNSLSLTLDLKTGEKYSVDFGRTVLNQTAVAVVSLDGERWAFVFPPILYGLVAESLTIPPDSP